MLTRPRLAALILLVLLLAGCDRPDPTTQFPAEPPSTATITAPPTTLAAADCPTVLVECPRPDVTPGAVIASTDGVCTPAFNPRRSLTAAEKRRVLAAYGIPAGTRVQEYDHYVARWAGGPSDLRNVWPMVSVADKRRKDALEEQLYQAVCKSKTLTLAEARDRMRHFWAWWDPPTTTTKGSSP